MQATTAEREPMALIFMAVTKHLGLAEEALHKFLVASKFVATAGSRFVVPLGAWGSNNKRHFCT